MERWPAATGVRVSGPAEETGLDEETFPDTCRYFWDDIVAREFSR